MSKHSNDDGRYTEERNLATADEDALEPLESLDLGRIADSDELLAAMARTAFGGRRLGEAAEVLEAMVVDPRCSVVMTLSGAMTVAKQSLLITEMVERGMIQAIISTGALMTHGLVELAGMEHYKAKDDLNDEVLFEKGYNRVFDTYELETNLNALGFMLRDIFASMKTGKVGSRHLTEAVGERLARTGKRGILSACYRKGVPVYIPAFTDSEMGLDFATFHLASRVEKGGSILEGLEKLETPFDPFLDLAHYTLFTQKADRLGIFTIGGGVPRNWAQQAAPFVDYANRALGTQAPMNRFRYGLRICPEPVYWGGLSGCTYSEGVSWGKFVPPAEGGRYAEVLSDATLVWPLLLQGVLQRMQKSGRSPSAPAMDLPGCRPRAGV